MYIDFFQSLHNTTKEACLMLHGFPAASYPDPSFEKNKDLGFFIAQNTKYDVFLPHYRGLGKSPGEFSFLESIEDARALANDLTDNKGYTKLHLLGHSWGGLVSMNVLSSLGNKIEKVILLSPFSEIPNPDVLKPLLLSVSADVTICYKAGSINDAVKEIMFVKENNNPRDIARTSTLDNIFIIQSTHDDEVSAESTRSFAGCFPKYPHYFEIDSDHKFLENRESLKALLFQILIGT